MSTVTMSDGREVDFGKKDYLLNTSVLENGSVRIQAAFADGEYREYVLPVWGEDKSLNDALSAYAAAGLEATFRRVLNGGMSKDFDAAVPLVSTGPSFRKPRASKAGAKLSPLQKALVEVTGKTAEEILTWCSTKSKNELLALRGDARVAPVLARINAEDKARKAAKKGDISDPLAELA